MPDRRETTLAYKVEDGELQALAALLGSISSQMANLSGSGAGPGTYNASVRPGQTAFPTPNYGAPTGPAPNVSAGGRPNPAAIGMQTPTFAGAGAPAGPAGSALGGPGGSFTISGAVSLHVSGTITIQAAGGVTVQGGGPAAPQAPGGGGGGVPGGGAVPVTPAGGGGGSQPPPVTPVQTGGGNPQNPFGNLGMPGASTLGAGGRIGLGMLLGQPTQFLGQGQNALVAGAQFYMGNQIGGALMNIAQPAINEMNYGNRGLHIAAAEDIAAMRWRAGSHALGALIGGGIGLGIGRSPWAIAAGASIGSGLIGAGGDFIADKIDRSLDVKLATQNIEAGFGVRQGTAKDWFTRSRISPVPFMQSGQWSDEIVATSSSMLETLSPGAVTDMETMGAITNVKRRLQRKYADPINKYLRAVVSDPMAGEMIASLDNKMSGRHAEELFGSGNAAWMAQYFGATGNMDAAFNASVVGGGGLRAADRAFTNTLSGRSMEAESQAQIGLIHTRAEVIARTRGGAAAASVLRSNELGSFYESLETGKSIEADQFDQLARIASTPEQRRLAQARAAGLRGEILQIGSERTFGRMVSAAESEYGQSSAILGSRLSQAQTSLAMQQRTNLYDPKMHGMYQAIGEDLQGFLDAEITKLKALKAVHAPAEILAPVYQRIKDFKSGIAANILDEFETTWSNAAIPGRAASAIGGARLRELLGSGQIYGPQMEEAFQRQRAGAASQLAVAKAAYADAVKTYGADSKQAIAAAQVVQDTQAAYSNQQFEQIGTKYGTYSNIASGAQSLFGGARQLIVGEGLGSQAALPATIGGIRMADTSIAIARAKLAEDMRTPGVGPSIIMGDREAIMQAQIGRQQAGLAATDVQMPAEYEIEQLHARNKLQRMESSFLEPGNMLDQYKKLYGGAMQRVSAIDDTENKLRAAGKLNPAQEARFEQQRESAKMEAFQYRVRMEDGWIDRLVSYSQGAPSFAGRARPTMAQGAAQLEYGQTDEHFRQARAFGFVSSRGYQYERARGFSTAGMGNQELFPGDLAQMALYGKNGKSSFPKTGGGGDAPDFASYGGGGAGDTDGATEGTASALLDAANQTNALLQQLLNVMTHGGGAVGHGGRELLLPGHGGPQPLGGVGLGAQLIYQLSVPGTNDNRRPRQ